MADIVSEPYDDPLEDKTDPKKKFDPEAQKCKAYNRGQSEACTCVAKDGYKSAIETKLKSFYGKFNPEKLGKDGEIKDVEEVWKKWKGKEPDMFMALASKYKTKAVDIRANPKAKTPPFKPRPVDEEADYSAGADFRR